MVLKRSYLALLLMTGTTASVAQVKSLGSGVFNWNDLKVEKSETNERRQILDGKTLDLEYFEIHTSTLEPGKAPHASHTHDDEGSSPLDDRS